MPPHLPTVEPATGDPASCWAFANMVRMADADVKHVANNESQVLNKRKPVHFIPNPTNISDNAEVRNM